MRDQPHDSTTDWEEDLVKAIMGMRHAWRERMKDFPSSEFHLHAHAAHREMLLAARSLLDAAIQRIEQKPHAEAEDQPKPAERITLD